MQDGEAGPERARRASPETHERQLHTLAENIPDFLARFDRECRHLYVNAAVREAFGMSMEDFVGKTLHELPLASDPEQNDLLEAGIRRAFEEGAPNVTEAVWRTQSGERILEVRHVPELDERGDVVSVLGITRDFTQMRRLEREIRQAQKMEAAGRLAAGLAHDFNNLLTIIAGDAETVLEHLPAEDPDRMLLQEALRSCERAAKLSQRLLAFSSRLELRPRVVDLNALLDELLPSLRRLVGEDVVVALEAGAEPSLVRVDPEQFERALLNIAANARDAMPRGGRLAIETSNVDPDEGDAWRHPHLARACLRVTVRDSGEGMDEATRSRIFEPFFTTKGPDKGTGLGLAMVYGFVGQSGGRIDVQSEPGRGTSFTIDLPRAEADPLRRGASGARS
jgi:two-component system cell cycle sensor histidine kinase/response regulator CckA